MDAILTIGNCARGDCGVTSLGKYGIREQTITDTAYLTKSNLYYTYLRHNRITTSLSDAVIPDKISDDMPHNCEAYFKLFSGRLSTATESLRVVFSLIGHEKTNKSLM